MTEEQLERLAGIAHLPMSFTTIRWGISDREALRALLTEHKELKATVERQREVLRVYEDEHGVSVSGLNYINGRITQEEFRAAIGVTTQHSRNLRKP